MIEGNSYITAEKPVYQGGKLVAYEIEERLKARTVVAYTITEMGKAALAEGSRRAKAQMQALEVLLHATEPLDRKEAEAQHISGAVLQTLAEKGWALHAMVLDIDVGPHLQTHKLLTSVIFAFVTSEKAVNTPVFCVV